MNKTEIGNAIEQIIIALQNLKNIIQNSKEWMTESEMELLDLKKILNSKEWTKAIDERLICETEEDHFQRGKIILEENVNEYLEALKFLDYGCGEGYVNKASLEQKPTLSIGYDIAKQGNMTWETYENNMLLTTNFEKIKEHAPYDVILLHDVLDHILQETPEELMLKIRTLMDKKSILYVKVHPFVSKHGSHLYRQINKAFIHLIFSEEELKDMGYISELTQKVIFPIKTYRDLFKSFRIITEYVHKEQIPEFIKQDIFKKRIYKNFNLDEDKPFPYVQMEQSFLDFQLKLN